MPLELPYSASYVAVSFVSVVVGSHFGESRPQPVVSHCHCGSEHTEHHGGIFSGLVNGVVRFSIGCLGVSLAWCFYRISQPIVGPTVRKPAGTAEATGGPFVSSFASDIEFIAARRKVGDFEPEVDKLPQSEPPSKGPITRSNKKLCRT